MRRDPTAAKPNEHPAVADGTGELGARSATNGSALMTADQVASLLGVPKSWVYEQSRTGRIPTVTLGRYRRYRRAAIDAWISAIETPGPA